MTVIDHKRVLAYYAYLGMKARVIELQERIVTRNALRHQFGKDAIDPAHQDSRFLLSHNQEKTWRGWDKQDYDLLDVLIPLMRMIEKDFEHSFTEDQIENRTKTEK